MSNIGYCEGDRCEREGCEGIIELEDVENCSCHILAPCWEHESAGIHCPDCGWCSADDPLCAREISSIGMGGPLPLIETNRRVILPKQN